jgi:hypothetical protein
MAFVLLYLPWERRAFWFYLILTAVILLNSQFYVFLAGRTGRLLALAAIPFHLLYHFYNGISFAIGMLRHLTRRPFAAHAKSASPEMKREEVPVSSDS